LAGPKPSAGGRSHRSVSAVRWPGVREGWRQYRKMLSRMRQCRKHHGVCVDCCVTLRFACYGSSLACYPPVFGNASFRILGFKGPEMIMLRHFQSPRPESGLEAPDTGERRFGFIAALRTEKTGSKAWSLNVHIRGTNWSHESRWRITLKGRDERSIDDHQHTGILLVGVVGGHHLKPDRYLLPGYIDIR